MKSIQSFSNKKKKKQPLLPHPISPSPVFGVHSRSFHPEAAKATSMPHPACRSDPSSERAHSAFFSFPGSPQNSQSENKESRSKIYL